jgi:hypothetical protein
MIPGARSIDVSSVMVCGSGRVKVIFIRFGWVNCEAV